MTSGRFAEFRHRYWLELAIVRSFRAAPPGGAGAVSGPDAADREQNASEVVVLAELLRECPSVP